MYLPYAAPIRSSVCHCKKFPKRTLISGRRIFFLPPPPLPSFPLCPRNPRGYYFSSPQSSSVIKSKMAATTIRTWTSFRPPKIRLHCRLFIFRIKSLHFHKTKMFSYQLLNGQRLIITACEQSLCLGKGWKNRKMREGKGWEPVDKHLSPSFNGTCCASHPDASSYWREHWLLTGLIYTAFFGRHGGGGGEWGTPHMKVVRMLVGYFELNP